MSLEYFLTALVVVLLPGTGVIYTVSIGMTRGWLLAVFAALGCTFGIVPHMLASVLGLAAILHTSAVAFQVVKYAGVCYLLYLAYGMWKETGHLRFKAQETRRNGFRTALHGTLINILNPKLSLFFLAFLPQFVESGAKDSFSQMMVLSLIFMALTLAVFVVYGMAAAWVRRYVLENDRILRLLQRSFAAVFVFLGLRLALEER